MAANVECLVEHHLMFMDVCVCLSQIFCPYFFIWIFLVFLDFAFLYLYWISSIPIPNLKYRLMHLMLLCIFQTKLSCHIHLNHLVVQLVDLLLDELERGEENRVDHAWSSHRYTQTSVHPLVEELDLWCFLGFLSSADCQTIALVDTLSRIDWIYQSPAHNTTQTSCNNNGEWIGRRWIFAIGCEKLLATFIRHEVYRCSQGIPHCIKISKVREPTARNTYINGGWDLSTIQQFPGAL